MRYGSEELRNQPWGLKRSADMGDLIIERRRGWVDVLGGWALEKIKTVFLCSFS